MSFSACGKKDKAKLKNADDMTFEIDSEGNSEENGSADETGTATGEKGKGNSKDSGSSSSKSLDSLSWKKLLAQMPSSLRGTTVKVASWNPVKDVTGAQKVIDTFTKVTGIKVKWEQINYDQYDQQIAAYIQAGNSPDVFRYQHSSPARMAMGQDLKKATGQDFAGSIWDKSTKDVFTVNGKLYGVNLANTFNMQPMVVHYSASTIANNDMEDPYVLWKSGKWTYKKFKEMCDDFRVKTHGTGGWMSSYRVDIMSMRGLQLITFDGKKFKNNAKNSQILLAVQEAINCYKKETMTSAMREHKYLENGTFVFFTDNMIGSRRTDFHFSTLKANGDLRVVPLPKQEGQEFIQPMHESEAYGIPKGAKNPKAVYYYLRYYLNADNYDSETFSVNDQALEVYKWCISQKNKFHYYDVYKDLPDFATASGTQASDAKTKLDQISPQIDADVKEWNRIISTF